MGMMYCISARPRGLKSSPPAWLQLSRTDNRSKNSRSLPPKFYKLAKLGVSNGTAVSIINLPIGKLFNSILKVEYMEYPL